MENPVQAALASKERVKLTVCGAVQGVGFRPFIFRLATELCLQGWVRNSAQGVFIETEGPRPELEVFLLRLAKEKPPRSFIQSLETSWLDPVGYSGFEIRPSETGGARTALVLPDMATCPDCVSEIFDPGNRRYQYPFTNCTHCGPRFSIIESLPYDRGNTSMKAFDMCPQCRAEYDDPSNRRFHAQPNACPVCGPHLELWDRLGHAVAPPGHDSLIAAAEAVRTGKILALKGLGGFQLIVAGPDDAAVQRLRQLKHREEKPFALMLPSLDLAKSICDLAPLEERLLLSPEAPIVLLRRQSHQAFPRLISPHIAPANPNLGIMLPYTPLHHLLLSILGFPIVATSGNLSDEPICIEEHEALERLGAIADLFLVHNRPIVRHVDDSIARILGGRELVLRRARGYAPLPVQLRVGAPGSSIGSEKGCVLAVGAHLKNTVALLMGSQIFVSQHIGDLETAQAYSAFCRVISDFQKLYDVRPQVIVADAHPDYLSTKFARELCAQEPVSTGADPPLIASTGGLKNGVRYVSVQHHFAHVLACMAENELEPPVLGVAWDGTGYGLDQTIWGGEFFLIKPNSWERVAHLRSFPLPGGDQAVKEPRRTAIGLLFALFGDAAFQQKELAPLATFSPAELNSLKTMLARRLNSPLTSSVGRLFDAIAALVDLRQFVRFEGQAAMELEFAMDGAETNDAYPLPVSPAEPALGSPHLSLIIDWEPLVKSVLEDVRRRVLLARISAKFHNALAESIVAVARHFGQKRVALSGGCFQNRYLAEHTIQRLLTEGFRPYWHQRIPPNDGGIAVGQAAATLLRED